MRYCVVLRSKHTGEPIHLGSSYATREEAEAEIEQNVCQRCNYADVQMIQDDMVWADRHKGFMPADMDQKYKEATVESQS